MLRYIRNVKGFFSDYYLGSIFAETHRSNKKLLSEQTQIAYLKFQKIWERAEGHATRPAECREKFIRPLLRDILGFHLGSSDSQLHFLYASADSEIRHEKPILAAYCGSWVEELDAGHAMSSPMRITQQLLSREGLRYGFLITGEKMRLIRAPGDGPRDAYLEVDICGLIEEKDLESFWAFLMLFSITNYLMNSEGKAPIDVIERESREHAEKVSEDLKVAVFSAAERLASGLIEDDKRKNRLSVPFDLSESQLLLYRDTALICLYRMLFIFYAEARDSRLDSHPVYQESYSLNGLLEEILQRPQFSWPENRASFWSRLLSLFHIYDEGLPRISQWEHIPPRGSDFFSPRTPEGQMLESASLSDRLVAQIILYLATSVPRAGVGRERVSFRELDIENLGAVYEGLLEYEPRLAKGVVLEVRVQGKIYGLSPDDLIRLCRQKGLVLRGDLSLVLGTSAMILASSQSESEENDKLSSEEEDNITSDNEVSTTEVDVGSEERSGSESEEHIKRGAPAKLMRRIEPGHFYFIPGPAKKGSGSFYTPRILVRDLVRHTLGPLVYEKSSEEIEKIRILDPACGSGHFLVETMRYLGQSLHRAYVEELKEQPPAEFRSTTGQGWDTDWKASDEEARVSNSEARAWCKRRIVERCLFGVDLNPTAVQLARVALWIESVAGDRPLTYFEHHIRCGNSLLGTWLASYQRPPIPTLERQGQKSQPRSKKSSTRSVRAAAGEKSIKLLSFQPSLFQQYVKKVLSDATETRLKIDSVTHEELLQEGIEPESLQEQDYKEQQRKRYQEIISTIKLLFDLRSASAFVPEIWREWDYLCDLVQKPEDFKSYTRTCDWWQNFQMVKERERFFHWELEFPEVLLDNGVRGFDVVLGNPPWEKVKPDRKEFYGRVDILIRAFRGAELERRIRELEESLPYLNQKFEDYENQRKITAMFLTKGGDFQFHDSIVDGNTTGGDPDLFKFFLEQAWKLAAENSRVGFVVPSAIYNNEGCTGLRHLLLDEVCVERFYAFENRRKIFPIDSRFKFVNLVFRKTKPQDKSSFMAAFMRHDLEELDETSIWKEPGKSTALPGPIPWMVEVSKEELEKISPGTLSFLEYRNHRDRQILLKMYQGHPLLCEQGPETWNAIFYTEYHMTNDSDLWTDAETGKLWNPRQILGNVPGTSVEAPFYELSAWLQIRSLMAEKGFWPLYEGKHIDQFLIDTKPIEKWVNLEAAQKKYGCSPNPGPKLVFRAVASNTNERTCIAAILPEWSCFGNSCWGATINEDYAILLCGILNSIPNDFSVRLRVSANMNFTHAGKMAVLSPSQAKCLPKFKTMSIYQHKIESVYNNQFYFEELWNLNRAVSEAYGLTPEDFEYILSTFPVFARKHPGFFSYLQDRISEWKSEASKKEFAAGEYPVQMQSEIGEAAESRIDYKKQDQGK